MKITINKSQWEGMGKKAGWMKEAGGAEVGVNQAFSDVAAGIKESGQAKVQEYAQRIMKGEPKEKVLEGIGPAFRQNVENALAKIQQSSGQPSQTQSQSQSSQSESRSGNVLESKNIIVNAQNVSVQTKPEKKGWGMIIFLIAILLILLGGLFALVSFQTVKPLYSMRT